MNIRSNPDTTLPAVTTGPLPASRKIFVDARRSARPARAPARDHAVAKAPASRTCRSMTPPAPTPIRRVTIDVNAGLAAPPHRLGQGARRRRGI